MHVVLGSTGQLGGAVLRSLRHRGEEVVAVTRRPERAAGLRARGAVPVVGDLLDPVRLAAALPAGARLFVVNPPADPTRGADPEAEERGTADAVADLVAAVHPERVVAVSTYGARPGRGIGDLGTLHHLEERLVEVSAPVAVLRVAYLLSNYDGVVGTVREQGVLPTLLDPATPLPMVAPADVGEAAADLLTGPQPARGTHHVEGPRPASPGEVAAAFARVLGRSVDPVLTPPEEWEPMFLGLGFTPAVAASFAAMTRIVAGGDLERPADPVRGRTTALAYVTALVRDR